MNHPDNGERTRSLLCVRKALSNELCEAVEILRASYIQAQGKTFCFREETANDVILRRLSYPASQRLKDMNANASTLRIQPSILTAKKFRPDEIQGIGLRLMKRFWFRRYSKNTSCPAVLWHRHSGGGHRTFPVLINYGSSASGDEPIC
ncbi:hypothetical protein SMC92_004754 [Cronobacter dublinensis]|nr:hypothetical protein [Cronobacter dublinensis]